MEETVINNIDNYRLPTEIEGSDDSDDILLTKKALEMLKFLREENNVPEEFYLRLSTQGSGCSGMQFALGYDSEIKDGDRILELEGEKFIVSAKSIFFMMGITIDYTDGPQGSGFVFNNPNDLPSCGGCSAFH